MNTLYYGDNLNILREYIKNETVDLIYLDPPTPAGFGGQKGWKSGGKGSRPGGAGNLINCHSEERSL